MLATHFKMSVYNNAASLLLDLNNKDVALVQDYYVKHRCPPQSRSLPLDQWNQTLDGLKTVTLTSKVKIFKVDLKQWDNTSPAWCRE